MPGVTRKIEFDELFSMFEEQRITMSGRDLAGDMKPMLGGL